MAERNAEVGMRDDMKKELSILPLVSKLIFGQGTQGNSTQHKRAGVEDHLLLTGLPLLSNQMNGF